MSTAMKTRKPKATKKKMSRTLAQESPREVEQASPALAEQSVPTHVVGKPAEVEPSERAFSHSEEPESAMQSAEAPDAGYGRCTESSDWENRGRS